MNYTNMLCRKFEKIYYLQSEFKYTTSFWFYEVLQAIMFVLVLRSSSFPGNNYTMRFWFDEVLQATIIPCLFDSTKFSGQQLYHAVLVLQTNFNLWRVCSLTMNCAIVRLRQKMKHWRVKKYRLSMILWKKQTSWNSQVVVEKNRHAYSNSQFTLQSRQDMWVVSKLPCSLYNHQVIKTCTTI